MTLPMPATFEEIVGGILRRELEPIREQLQLIRGDTAVRKDGGDLLTVREAAAVAKVNEWTIREWIRRGVLKELRRGKVIRIRRQDLETTLDGGPATRSLSSPEDQAVVILRRANSRRG